MTTMGIARCRGPISMRPLWAEAAPSGRQQHCMSGWIMKRAEVPPVSRGLPDIWGQPHCQPSLV